MAIVNSLGPAPTPPSLETNQYQKQLEPQKSKDFGKVLESEKTVLQKKSPLKTPQQDQTGTDLALKELSIAMENEFLSSTWKSAFDTVKENYEGGLGEELFNRELIEHQIRDMNKGGRMGELAQQIYDEMKSKQEADSGTTNQQK